MFDHLFVDASESHFLIEAESDDPDWRATAEACDVPISDIDSRSDNDSA